MLTTSDLLSMDNDALYEVYRYGVEQKDLKLINNCRSIISDRYSLKALKQSQLDEPFKNPDISKFFNVK